MKIYIFERLINLFSQHKQHKFSQRWEIASLRCKQIFWNGMILLLSHFPAYFKKNNCYLPSYYEIFDLPGYLRSFSVNDRPFMEEFTGTMLFSKFIEDAWQASNGRNWEEKRQMKEKESEEEMMIMEGGMKIEDEKGRRKEEEEVESFYEYNRKNDEINYKKEENLEKEVGEREAEDWKDEEEVMDEIKVFKRDWRVLRGEGIKEVEERQEEKMREILERNKNVKKNKKNTSAFSIFINFLKPENKHLMVYFAKFMKFIEIHRSLNTSKKTADKINVSQNLKKFNESRQKFPKLNRNIIIDLENVSEAVNSCIFNN